MPQSGIRIKSDFLGENLYFTIGKTFIDITIPHENRPDNADLRKAADQIVIHAPHRDWISKHQFYEDIKNIVTEVKPKNQHKLDLLMERTADAVVKAWEVIDGRKK